MLHLFSLSSILVALEILTFISYASLEGIPETPAQGGCDRAQIVVVFITAKSVECGSPSISRAQVKVGQGEVMR